LPGWQQYYQAHHSDTFELVSVASDMGGDDAVRTWTERAGATFPTVIDADNTLGALLGFKAIPNGVLIDHDGIIRYAKYGGFEVSNAAELAAFEAALRGSSGQTPHADAAGRLTPELQERVAALLRTGFQRMAAGDRDAGLDAWRQALALDPANFVIRKQLWRADHPERFGEEIDFAWQQGQLAAEREREAAGR